MYKCFSKPPQQKPNSSTCIDLYLLWLWCLDPGIVLINHAESVPVKTNSVWFRKLSPEELERKRKEMMDEAKQRDEDRENNVKRYEKQEEQERQLEKSVKHERHAGFIQ